MRLAYLGLLAPAVSACAQAAASEVRTQRAVSAAAPQQRANLPATPPAPAVTAAERAQQPESRRVTCPLGMALLSRAQGHYCIDRYEASLCRRAGNACRTWPGNRTVDGYEDQLEAVSVPGIKPQGYISAVQAARVCANAGKRLCEVDEWVRACKGPDLALYPYGNQRQPDICNDRFERLDRHPVVRLFNSAAPAEADRNSMWNATWMNDPRLHEMSHSVVASGSFKGCTNAYEVYDMVGNLHEWVADPDGTFLGGFFMDTYQNGEGCDYRTQAHPPSYHDYSTGFRCCANPVLAR